MQLKHGDYTDIVQLLLVVSFLNRLNNSVSPAVRQLVLKVGAKAVISCDFLAQRNEDYSSGGSCFSVLVCPLLSVCIACRCSNVRSNADALFCILQG